MPHRTFRDTTGAEWQVWDVRPSSGMGGAVSPGFAGGWLCFERLPGRAKPPGGTERRRVPPAPPAPAAPAERRRLAPLPPGWEVLPDATLEALLRRAKSSR